MIADTARSAPRFGDRRAQRPLRNTRDPSVNGMMVDTVGLLCPGSPAADFPPSRGEVLCTCRVQREPQPCWRRFAGSHYGGPSAKDRRRVAGRLGQPHRYSYRSEGLGSAQEATGTKKRTQMVGGRRKMVPSQPTTKAKCSGGPVGAL